MVPRTPRGFAATSLIYARRSADEPDVALFWINCLASAINICRFLQRYSS